MVQDVFWVTVVAVATLLLATAAVARATDARSLEHWNEVRLMMPPPGKPLRYAASCGWRRGYHLLLRMSNRDLPRPGRRLASARRSRDRSSDAAATTSAVGANQSPQSRNSDQGATAGVTRAT